jgi:hypothetical protein
VFNFGFKVGYFSQNDIFLVCSLNQTYFFASKSRFAQKANPQQIRRQQNVLFKEKETL